MKMENDVKIIVTVGPSILEGDKLENLPKEANYIFRINGSHLSEDSCHDLVARIRRLDENTKILLDFPGNKIRTIGIKDPIELKVGERFRLEHDMISHSIFFERLEIGDTVRAHDSLLMFDVVEKGSQHMEFQSNTNGVLKGNKGLHKCGLTDGIEFLTEHDKRLLNVAKDLGVDCIGASYVRDENDINILKEYVAAIDYNPDIFVKIETKKVIDSLENVLQNSDNFILDRGDLSSEVGIENIALYQNKVIKEAKKAGRNLFLATQFLKSMVYNPVPLIAEVNDLSNVLSSGIAGVQLSDETAMGRYPIESINVVLRLRDSLMDINLNG